MSSIKFSFCGNIFLNHFFYKKNEGNLDILFKNCEKSLFYDIDFTVLNFKNNFLNKTINNEKVLGILEPFKKYKNNIIISSSKKFNVLKFNNINTIIPYSQNKIFYNLDLKYNVFIKNIKGINVCFLSFLESFFEINTDNNFDIKSTKNIRLHQPEFKMKQQ
jgi:hypothetical protein